MEQPQGMNAPEQTGSPIMVDNLGAELLGKYQQWKQARQIKELEWLDDLRAFNSQYNSEDLAILNDPTREGMSKVFVGKTRMKVTAAYSRITELLFQPGQKYWGVSATPQPDTEAFVGAAKNAKIEIMQAIQAGMIDPQAVDMEELIESRKEELENDAINEAMEAAKEMENVIDDQLKECFADREIKRALMEMIIFGNGCIKGATVDIKQNPKWTKQQDDSWEMQNVEEVVPIITHRSIFNIYPDPYAVGMDKATGLFDRHMMTQTEFKKLASFKGFNAQAIDDIITNNSSGNYVEEYHEIERRTISGMNTSWGVTGRFDVLEYWGGVSGKDLQDVGVAVDDVNEEYQANVWFCMGKVIKAMLNPLLPARIPYQVVPYERGLHSFWGIGIPAMMRDSQRIINASARMVIDNSALSAGSQVEVNTDMVAPGTDIKRMSPFKIWARTGGDTNSPLLRFHQVPNNSQGLLNLMQVFGQYADEETSLPAYSYGQVGQDMTQTASGMSMLMGAATVSIKNVIKNIDDYLFEPMVQSFFDWNMRWNDREDIKGDSFVIAQGSTALMSKEVKSQRVLSFAQMVANPMFAPLVDAHELLNEVANAMDLPADKLIYSEKELEAKQQQQQADLLAQQQQSMGGLNTGIAGQQGAPAQPAMQGA